MNFGGGVVGSMSSQGSSLTQKPSSGDIVSDLFPVGLRVLVVDDDPTCLTILDKMLRKCHYEVTKCSRAEVALSLLRENKNGYDIVISDVHMPDMDGFKLLVYIGLEMDLPVISKLACYCLDLYHVMSADDSNDVVMKGVTHGACDYLIKPVRMEALKNIWQHVFRKKKNEWKELEQSGSVDDEGDRQPKQDESDYSSPSANEGSWKSSKRKGEDEDGEDKDDTATLKKPRVVWSVELHQQFVSAVNQLGIDKAVPKKILELMNVPGLTRENVASHLQKFRLYLRRLSGVSPLQPGGLNDSFLSGDLSFGTMTPLSGLDLQALAVASQLPAQTLATYQAAGLGRAAVKPAISMPFMDQRNLFGFESPIRFGDGQQQQQQLSNSNAKQMNLLHGIPTMMEPKQLASLHQSPQPLASLNNNNDNMQGNAHAHGGSQNSSLLVQMVQPQPQPQPQPRGQILTGMIGGQSPRTASSIPQRNGPTDGGQTIAYNPISQATTVVDFSATHIPDLAGNGFPLGSTPGIISLTCKKLFQEGMSSDKKGGRGFASTYGIFNEHEQHKGLDWSLQNAAVVPTKTSVKNTINVPPSVMVHQAFPSSQKNGENNVSLVGRRTVMSTGPDRELGSTNRSINEKVNNILIDNASKVKPERVQEISSVTNPFSDHFGQDDLMSVLFKQHQEGHGSVENDFDFDGLQMDDIPV